MDTYNIEGFIQPNNMMILLNIAIVLLFIQGIDATTSSGGGSSTIGYQPTSNDEQWVAEEEFHGASQQQHQPKQHKKKKKKVKESSSYPGHEHINEQSWWDEDDTDERLSMQEQSTTLQPSIATTKEEKKKTHSKKHRIRIWKNKSTTTKSSVGDDNSSISQTDKKTNQDTNTSTESSTSNSSEYDEEHPMRTDEWQLNIQLSRLYSNKHDMNELFPQCYSITDISTKDQNVPSTRRKSSSGYYRKRQVMQFARNGYVKILLDDHDTDSTDTTQRKRQRVGKWRIGHSGVAFDIPVQVSPRRKKGRKSSSEQQPRLTTLHYHADIHLNKFGERPRMFRGVITRDRYASSFLPPNFLRPVIGTFSAEGIGHDTSDTSYRERAISLSRQQVINEAKGEM